MIDFYKHKLNKEELVPIKVKYLIHKNFQTAFDIIENSKVLGIEWDCDVDGTACGAISNFCISKMYPNKVIHNLGNKTKTHGITNKIVEECINNSIDTLIVVDAGTNDTLKIQELKDEGIAVIVIDHHVISDETDTTEFVLINSQEVEGYENVSGAFVVASFFDWALKRKLGNHKYSFEELVALTVISDVCKRDDINKSILFNYLFGNTPKCSIPIVSELESKYETNNINKLKQVSSSLNALIRYYGNEYLINKISTNIFNLRMIAKDVKFVKKQNNDIINKLIEGSKVYDLGNIVALFLPSKLQNYNDILIRNYVGIVANKVSNNTKKLTVILCPKSCDFECDGVYDFCFSVRDPHNRDTLSISNKIGINSNGHGSAWGGTINAKDIHKFVELNLLIEELNLTEPTMQYQIIKVKDIISQISTLSREEKDFIAINNLINAPERKVGYEFKLNGKVESVNGIKKVYIGDNTFKSFDANLSYGDKVVLFMEGFNTNDYVIKRVSG